MLAELAFDPILSVDMNLDSARPLVLGIDLASRFLKPRVVRRRSQKYKNVELRKEFASLVDLAWQLFHRQTALAPCRAVPASAALDAEASARSLIRPKDVDAGLGLAVAAVEIRVNVTDDPCKKIARQALECLPVARAIERRSGC